MAPRFNVWRTGRTSPPGPAGLSRHVPPLRTRATRTGTGSVTVLAYLESGDHGESASAGRRVTPYPGRRSDLPGYPGAARAVSCAVSSAIRAFSIRVNRKRREESRSWTTAMAVPQVVVGDNVVTRSAFVFDLPWRKCSADRVASAGGVPGPACARSAAGTAASRQQVTRVPDCSFVAGRLPWSAPERVSGTGKNRQPGGQHAFAPGAVGTPGQGRSTGIRRVPDAGRL
jgi:hypothetical protein